MLKEEIVFTPFSSYSGSLMAGMSARRIHDSSEPYSHAEYVGHVGAIFSNVLHFAVYTTKTEVACLFAASGRLNMPLPPPM